jgi:hypothetical protein
MADEPGIREGRFSVSRSLGPGSGFVRSGDLVLPERMTARLEYPEDHTIEVDVVVIDGAPVCDAIRVVRHPDRPSLRGAELRLVPVDDLIAMACAEVAMRVESTGRGNVRATLVPDPELPETFGRFRRGQRRNAITDALLQDVARTWREGKSTGAPAEHVREAFGVSPRTAARYIRLARERGFLEPKGTQ